jgi:hypothetical protein
MIGRFTASIMSFFLRSGGQVQFLQPDLKTPFQGNSHLPIRIRELAGRGEAWGTSEARLILEYAFDVGRSGIYLKLTPGQCPELKRSCERRGRSQLSPNRSCLTTCLASLRWTKIRRALPSAAIEAPSGTRLDHRKVMRTTHGTLHQSV